MIEVKIEDNYLNLYRDEEESPIYFIAISDLSRIRIAHNNKISHWIEQLLSKTWINEENLYQIAAITQKQFPENDIDWIATFFPIEKKQYVNHIRATNQLITGDTGSDDTAERLRISVQEQNPFVIDNIKEIIKNKLVEYGV